MPKVKRKINAKAEAALAKLTKDFSSKELNVGWFSNSRYDDKNATPVAYVASIQEFGSESGRIPPRPFMRPTIAEQKATWRKFLKSSSKQILKGSKTVEQTFEQLGLQASGKIAAQIADVYQPPLAKSTIKARLRKRANKTAVGSLDKPLVDFGVMQKTVTYTVS